VSVCNMGLTHLAIEVLNHRELFEKNFSDIYSITKRELATKLESESIHDRIFGNWLIPLATFRTLETAIDVPFIYTELFETAVKGIRNQNDLAQEISEVADFGICCKASRRLGSAWKRRIIRYATCARSVRFRQKRILSSRRHDLSFT